MGKRKTSATAAPEAGATQSRREPIPVTLLSGFLGAGKTTLLNHLLENTSDMKIVVIVNDMSAVNIDAKLVRRTSEKMIELSNGCICCTLREDLLAQLLELGTTSDADAILIESTGISEPIHVAETFSHSKFIGTDLNTLVRLDTMVTVVDTKHFCAYFKGVDAPGDMIKEALNCPAPTTAPSIDGAAPAADRTLIDLLIDQVQFSDVIVLNKTDSVSATELRDVESIVRDLNPHAKIIKSNYGKVPPSQIINTRLFSFEKAEQHADWFAEEWGASVPESEEYGISSFVYERRRPFHPARLQSALLHTRELITSASTELAQKKRKLNEGGESKLGSTCHPISRLIRSKGFIWLATRNDHYVQIHVAGGSVHASRGGQWWVDTPRENWPKDKDFEREVLSKFQEPYGDRAQTLVCIGLHMDKVAVERALDECLLTDQEMELGVDGWSRAFEDNDFWTLCHDDNKASSEPDSKQSNSSEEPSSCQLGTHDHTHEHSHAHEGQVCVGGEEENTETGP